MKSIYEKIDELSDDLIGVYDRDSRIRGELKHELMDARKEGLEAGLKEGIKEATRIMVLNMIDENINIDTISKISGLTKEEIENISNNK